ncbi:MAG: hypothetical protein PHQ65_09410 [Bacteroidales bacterium]|nr:hypothetical protein [Bacteroidales bacterium]MDD3665466.1 hypothetical protein [Bacteroidales bacterium]
MVLPTQKGGITTLSHGFTNPKSDEKLTKSFEEGLRHVGKPLEEVVVDCGGE